MIPISVVVPTYNRERFLREAIRSVMDQTMLPCELIIVDDGSNDSTQELVRVCHGPVPIIYFQQDNQGPAAARNFGVSLAREGWIAFLDADDVWHPNKLAEQWRALRENPRISFVYCDMAAIDADGEPADQGRTTGELVQMFFGAYPFPFPSTVLMRKELFIEAGGFNPSLQLHEDLLLFARIATMGAVYYLPQRLVDYRLHLFQIGRDQPVRQKNWPHVLDALYAMVWHEPEKRAIVEREFERYYSSCARARLLSEDYSRARQDFGRALEYAPLSLKNLAGMLVTVLPGVREWYRRYETERRRRLLKSRRLGDHESMLKCPACGFCHTWFRPVEQRATHYQGHVWQYTIHRCAECQTQFAQPRQSAPAEWYEQIGEYYGWRWEFDEFLADLQPRCGEARVARLLEIGCGEGALIARLTGEHEVYGLEVNSKAAEHARDKQLPVFACSLEQFTRMHSDLRFDGVACFQVIEHLENPFAFLKAVKDVLVEDGHVYLSVPNPDRFQLRVQREVWDYPPHHLTRFSKIGLRRLLERSGFEVITWRDRPFTQEDARRLRKGMYARLPIPEFLKGLFWYPMQLWLYLWCSRLRTACTGQDLYVVARVRSCPALDPPSVEPVAFPIHVAERRPARESNVCGSNV